jgi:hypothetical protein
MSKPPNYVITTQIKVYRETEQEAQQLANLLAQIAGGLTDNNTAAIRIQKTKEQA